MTEGDPSFKVWTIRKLEDINEVDEWQIDKCIHFLNHVIRKCRIQKRRLVEMVYHEKGRIIVTTQDVATGEIFIDPPPIKEASVEVVEEIEDPLA